MNTKETLVQEIANRRTQIVELEVEIAAIKAELAKQADFRIGDIVSKGKEIFQLTNLAIYDDGSFGWIEGSKRRPDGSFEFGSYYLDGDKLKLIERQP